jgi:hypothetical protein
MDTEVPSVDLEGHRARAFRRSRGSLSEHGQSPGGVRTRSGATQTATKAAALLLGAGAGALLGSTAIHLWDPDVAKHVRTEFVADRVSRR